MGITLLFHDGSYIELGVQGPNAEDFQWLGGPLHGVKWKASGDKITQTQLGFNSCYCTTTAVGFTTPVMLGEQVPVTFYTDSTTPSVYNTLYNSCLQEV